MKLWKIASNFLVLSLGAVIGDYVPVLWEEFGRAPFSYSAKIICVQICVLALWILWNGYGILIARLSETELRRVKSIDALTWLPLLLLFLYSRNHFINEQFFGKYYGVAYLITVFSFVLLFKTAHLAAIIGKSRTWAVAVLVSFIIAMVVSGLRMELGTNLFRWLRLDVFIAVQFSMAAVLSIIALISGLVVGKGYRSLKGVLGLFVFLSFWWSYTAAPEQEILPPPSSVERMRESLPMKYFAKGGSAKRVRVNVSDEVRDALLFPVPGKASQRMDIKPGDKLAFGLGIPIYNKDSVKNGIRFELNIDTGGGGATAWSYLMDPLHVREDRRWKDFVLDLTPYVGEGGILTIGVEGGPFGAVSSPVIVSADDGSKKPPNIIIVVIDTLRDDHVGVYGYDRDTTPFIDSLARTGVVFRNAVSTAPWTEPATFSLLAGMLPGQVDAGLWSSVVIAEGPDFISEILQRQEYRTAAVSGNYIVTHALNFDQGFETFNEQCHPWFHWRSAECVTDEGIEWARRGLGEPYVLYLHYVDPHARYYAPPPYREKFSRGYIGNDSRIAGGETVEFETMYELSGKRVELPEEDIQYMTDLYDGEVAYVDDQIKRLVDTLKAGGMLDNTVIVITSDHGEEFTEHGMLGHRLNLHGTLLNIPLIFWGNDLVPEGVSIDETVSIADISPTLIDMLGLDIPGNCWGRSLEPLWNGEVLEPRSCFAQRRQLYLDEWTVTDGKNKLILGHTKRKGIHNPRLFDLKNDPVELRNIAGNSSRQKNMRKEISDTLEWIDEHKFDLRGFPAQMDQNDFRKRMQALGYVGN